MAAECKIGTYTGNGAAQNIELGYIPDHVEIMNITDKNAGWEWFSSMNDGEAIALAAGPAPVASNGVSKLKGTNNTQKGFTIGTALSANGKTFAYRATRNGQY